MNSAFIAAAKDLLRPFILVVAIILLLTSSARADWYQYQNSRYGFVVEVLTNLVAAEPPANGDGRSWKAGDGSLEVVAFARLANMETSHEFRRLADQAKAEARQQESYFREGDGWFVHS